MPLFPHRLTEGHPFELATGKTVDVLARLKGWAGFHVVFYTFEDGQWNLMGHGHVTVEEWWALPTTAGHKV